MFPQTQIFSINHKVLIQISNMSDPVHHIHIPRNLNNQIETSKNLVSSHSTFSTLHAKNPNIIVKPQRGFK